MALIKNEYGHGSHFLICGDMNARIADKDDFVPLDISTHIDILPDNYICDNYMPRATQDKGFNANGAALLDFCKRTGFRIVNGRVGADAAVGKCTYVGSRGSSLIDYVITNQDFLKHFSNFYVNDPNIMSDHCLLNFELNFKVLENDISASVRETGRNESQFCNGKYVWVNDKADVFLNELLSESIKQQLNNISDSIIQATTSEEIDFSINTFTNLIESVAKPFYKNIHISQNAQTAKKNFTYNEECEFKKLEFFDMLNLYRADKTDTNRVNMVRAQTEFKAEVRLHKLNQDRAKTKRLVDAKYKNAKEYWKLIKDAANGDKGKAKTISANRFAEYFKAINNPEDAFFQLDEDGIYFQERFLDGEVQVIFSELDVEIKREEILKAIKQLKSGKSGGPDHLLNEFFIHGQHVLLPCLHSLFNKLLRAGHFPKLWAEGHIVPLHKKGDINNVNNYRGITLLSVLGKLFSRLLNNRLIEWAELYQVYIESQAGFRKCMSTVDSIFVLHGLITHMLNGGKRFYCAFIDFSKAFDYIVRDILWYKLVKLGLEGKYLSYKKLV